jgi:chemotaxis protein histidine kinase CheA
VSTPRIPAHTRRLAGLVHRPGGLTEDEAVSAADANLETIRERTLQRMDGTLQLMDAIGRTLEAGIDRQALEELYAHSNTIVGVAGVFGMGGLSAVAYSLCELIDRMRTSRTWNAQAVSVHLDSLRLMRASGPGHEENREMQAALRRLVDRVPAAPPG